MRAINLKTEHLVDPRGIDVTKPFLSWNCCEGNRQSAWQIKARDSTGMNPGSGAGRLVSNWDFFGGKTGRLSGSTRNRRCSRGRGSQPAI